MSGATVATMEIGNSVAAIVRAMGRSGYCVVPEVIPAARLGQVRQEVVAAQRAHRQAAAAELARTRSRGHRVGAAGVDNLRQVINATQCFAPYLAEQRILGAANALLGDFVRISCTDCVITNPGSERGYWHADWPYNATNSTHVKAPYPDALMHLSSIWMLTEFSAANGGTFIVPGSHRNTDNPAGETLRGFDRDGPHPQQTQVTGGAGSVHALRQPPVARGGTQRQQRGAGGPDHSLRSVVAEPHPHDSRHPRP